MKVLILDTKSYSGNFEHEVGGKMVPTPNYGNNGYGFQAELNDEGYENAKAHYIEYIEKNELGAIDKTLEFYKGSRADISRYNSEKERIFEKIEILKARDAKLFLPYPAYQSVQFNLSRYESVDSLDSIIDDLKKTTTEYCEKKGIEIIEWRLVDTTQLKTTKPDVVTQSERTDLKVLLFAYNEMLVIETVNPDDKEDSDFLPNEGGSIGCTLNNVKRLGASKEAMELINKMKRGRDAIGDLCGDKNSFSWVGDRYATLGPKLVSSRDFRMCEYVEIENNVPEGAKEAIDKSLAGVDLDYKDCQFSLWVEFRLDKKDDKPIYRVDTYMHPTYKYGGEERIINAPEGVLKEVDDTLYVKMTDETKKTICDLVYHNIFGEKLIVPRPPRDENEPETEQMKSFRELLAKLDADRDSFREFRHGYSACFDKNVVWDYANSFFDIGFMNNIMNPSEHAFRLSFNGTSAEIIERLSNFKLVP